MLQQQIHKTSGKADFVVWILFPSLLSSTAPLTRLHWFWSIDPPLASPRPDFSLLLPFLWWSAAEEGQALISSPLSGLSSPFPPCHKGMQAMGCGRQETAQVRGCRAGVQEGCRQGQWRQGVLPAVPYLLMASRGGSCPSDEVQHGAQRGAGFKQKGLREGIKAAGLVSPSSLLAAAWHGYSVCSLKRE